MEKNVRNQKKTLVNDDNKSTLSSLEDNKLLIPPKLISISMTSFFLLKKDFDQVFILQFQVCKPKNKASATLPTNKKTYAMTSSKKPCFCYINGVAFSYQFMHKILNILQFGNYLSLSLAQKLQTFKAVLATSKSAH